MSTRFSNATGTEDGIDEMNVKAEWNGWNESDKESDQYDQLFISWSNRWERVIRILIVTFLIILLLSQVMLQWPFFRKSFVKVERLEGEPYVQTFDSQSNR